MTDAASDDLDAATDAATVAADADDTEARDVDDASSEDGPAADAPGARTVEAERDEYLDALRRTQADFENYRKRAIKQQTDAIDRATGRLVEDLLPVLDACDAGIAHGDEGVTAIFTALLGTLEKSGLERLDPAGEPFDPNRHEAVLHEPADDDTEDGPVVAEVLRTGYVWKGRVVRAAMVKVKG